MAQGIPLTASWMDTVNARLPLLGILYYSGKKNYSPKLA